MAATAIHRLTLDPIGKCSNAFFSETTNIITAKLYMNVHWIVLYKLYVMYSLALIIFVVSEKKAFEYFPIGSNVNICIAVAAILGQLKPNCPGMIIGRSSTNFTFFVPI
jgi:hypothetical protein